MAEWNGLGRYPEDADVNDRPEEGTLLAYVDGSYQDALKKYGFGCIFILPDGRKNGSRSHHAGSAYHRKLLYYG